MSQPKWRCKTSVKTIGRCGYTIPSNNLISAKHGRWCGYEHSRNCRNWTALCSVLYQKGGNAMHRGLYRKGDKGKCRYCDHPVYAPSKNVNPKRACIKCRKNSTRQHDFKAYRLDTPWRSIPTFSQPLVQCLLDCPRLWPFVIFTVFFQTISQSAGNGQVELGTLVYWWRSNRGSTTWTDAFCHSSSPPTWHCIMPDGWCI